MCPDLERVWIMCLYDLESFQAYLDQLICIKSCKPTFYAHLLRIWKLTHFIRKVFATKILLSGKFSLFLTLSPVCGSGLPPLCNVLQCNVLLWLAKYAEAHGVALKPQLAPPCQCGHNNTLRRWSSWELIVVCPFTGSDPQVESGFGGSRSGGLQSRNNIPSHRPSSQALPRSYFNSAR